MLVQPCQGKLRAAPGQAWNPPGFAATAKGGQASPAPTNHEIPAKTAVVTIICSLSIACEALSPAGEALASETAVPAAHFLRRAFPEVTE